MVSSPANGASGGLALMWDLDFVEVVDELQGKFTLSVKCYLKGLDVLWICTNVYGPSTTFDKSDFWAELGSIRLRWNEPWLVMGDFNATRREEEREGVSNSRREKRDS